MSHALIITIHVLDAGFDAHPQAHHMYLHLEWIRPHDESKHQFHLFLSLQMVPSHGPAHEYYRHRHIYLRFNWRGNNHGRDCLLSGVGHFMSFEASQYVAECIRAAECMCATSRRK